jgi:colanic acid/amylovoran biosynthesis glycosyltransferase
MRVAFLVDQFPTLSETFILNQITGLIDRGHEVDIFSDRLGNTTKIHPQVEHYQLLNHTYYTPIPVNRFWRVIKGIGVFLGNFQKAPKTLLATLNFLKYQYSDYGEHALPLRAFYLAIPFLDKPPYDIIHCHYGRNGLKALILKDMGVLQGKIITVFHGNDLSRYLQTYGKQIYNKLFTEGDLLQPISQHWQRQLIDLGCPEDKIVVHRMGIDATKFSFTPRHLSQDNQIRLITIARLVEKKGIEYGIQAVAQLAKIHQNIEYQIIGDGPLREDFQQLIDKLDASNKIKLLGWRQQQEILQILQEAHIFLLPSVVSKDGDREGIPVSLMEAMAMGLPVVSTYHSGIPELVTDGVSGFLVPERDVAALVAKLDYLIKHRECLSNLGYAGRQQIEENYEINQLNERLVEIYQQLLKSNN